MSTIEKISEIHKLIMEIDKEDPALGQILLEGFGLSMNITKAIMEKGDREVDYSEHLQIIAKIMGFSLEDLVTSIVEKMAAEQEVNNKIADKDTLDFITATSSEDLDDYEKFIAENKAKESLDFLSKAI